MGGLCSTLTYIFETFIRVLILFGTNSPERETPIPLPPSLPFLAIREFST